MNVLKKFTTRSLKLNKKRSMVTIIGIILSVALICTVAGMVFSFRESMIEHSIRYVGRYHTMFRSVDSEAVNVANNHKKIDSIYFANNIGYAEFDSNNEYTPYVYLLGYSEGAFKESSLVLLEGRFPKADNEILLTEDFRAKSNVEYNIGDTIKLDLFELAYINEDYEDENYFEKSNEKRTPLFEKEYTVVGYAENLHYLLNSFHEMGTTIITYAGEPSDDTNLFIMYKDAKDAINLNGELANTFGQTEDMAYNNSELIRWSGAFSDETTNVLYIIMGIIIAIIMVTSVFIIRNGFSISVLERKRECGMFASIGATKKQIKKSVMYEGLLLGLVSIPLGVVLGLGVIYVLVLIVNNLLSFATENPIFLYIIPYEVIVLSILLGIATIYLSCYFIAKRTSKISPISSIRNSEDIKIKQKKLKAPKIIEKIFGEGGVIAYKNLKRNKKKYRTTVISMIVSVVLFISISSIVNYMFAENFKEYERVEYNINITLSYGDETTTFNDVSSKVVEIAGDDMYSIVRSNFAILDNRYINPYMAERFGLSMEDENGIMICSIGDRAYREYVEKIGGTYEEYREKGILYNQDIIFYTETEEKETGKMFNIKDNVELKVNDKKINLDITETEELAMPFTMRGGQESYIIVSDEMMEKIGYGEDMLEFIVVNSSNPNALTEELTAKFKNIYVYDTSEEVQNMKNISLMISIFLYGFISVISIICLTNIINTLTASLNLRKREFAMLKSIGMTAKEFRQMINLESIFLGLKVILIGVPIGMFLPFLIYNYINDIRYLNVKYDPNIVPVVVSIVLVFLIIGAIMHYSIKKINKQNIIETIRDNNV